MDAAATTRPEGKGPSGEVRPLARIDLPRVAELRWKALGERTHLDSRFLLAPDLHDRLPTVLSIWAEQEDRVTLVVTEGRGDDHDPLVGYATGIVSVWPPVWRAQRVGEVAEVYVLPEARGRGHGRLLLEGLLDALSSLGVDVLRAPVPKRQEASLRLFRALGFTPVLRVLERAVPPPGEL